MAPKVRVSGTSPSRMPSARKLATAHGAVQKSHAGVFTPTLCIASRPASRENPLASHTLPASLGGPLKAMASTLTARRLSSGRARRPW